MINVGQTYWFPLRIRNSSLSRLSDIIDRLNDRDDVEEAYAPLGFIRKSMTELGLAYKLVNYVFVRADMASLVAIKHSSATFEPLRFIMHPEYDADYNCRYSVLTISDKKMSDYKLVTEKENEKVVFIDNMDFANKPAPGVQITSGQFAGVIGRAKRIKGNKCVVLPIGKEIAFAIKDVPKKYLRFVSDEEMALLEENNMTENYGNIVQSKVQGFHR